MYRILLLIALMFSAAATAQNLIPNPSFESDTTYPVRSWPTQNQPGTSFTEGWTIPSRATPDYFNSDYSYIDYSPLMLAHSGKGRVAVISGLGQQLPESQNYKEYIQAQFTKPLEAGKTYEVSFWMALDRAAGYTSPGMGAYISQELVRADNKERLRVKPQIRYNRLLLTANGWVKVSGTLKATGGERYITIGSFSDTAVVPVAVLGQSYWTGPASMHVRRGSYFYIDDVCVAEKTADGCVCSKSPEEQQKEPEQTAVEPTGPDHYLFVIDASESMAEDGKIKEMRKQISDFARRLNISDRIAVMTFAEKPTLLFGFSPESTPESIDKVMRKIKPRGATNGDLALLTAARFIDSVRVNAKLHLIVATDGMFEISRRTERELDSALAHRQCSLDILHIGTKENTDLKRITERQADGAYFEATVPALTDFFTQMEPIPEPPKPAPLPPMRVRSRPEYTDMSRAPGYYGPAYRQD
ncbi:MAG: VWA domain-containing protein [Bacteroidia bacterium]